MMIIINPRETTDGEVLLRFSRYEYYYSAAARPVPKRVRRGKKGKIRGSLRQEERVQTQ